MLNDSAREMGETFRGKRILEIGTSREPGLPLILLLLGCEKYYASNILALDNWLPDAYINLIRLMMSGMLADTPQWGESLARIGLPGSLHQGGLRNHQHGACRWLGSTQCRKKLRYRQRYHRTRCLARAAR